ncbi:hypothetical protein [Methanotorris igneus]|uniref:Uncharacterized protein n=1 Tax=Methanotorris igneus (strain DSM 5666 / JCM 11834 / Kol 5) TaxID=880724 RepID=F6BF59_METIK|nr:hypothetical protein [Methanotorris igneus]AEF96929.1 hypothetical protein Metig_1394 [Methanotorris igneus Kol 5]
MGFLKTLFKFLVLVFVGFIFTLIGVGLKGILGLICYAISFIIFLVAYAYLIFKIVTWKYFWYIAFPVLIIILILAPIDGIILTIALIILRNSLIKLKNVFEGEDENNHL